VRRVYYVYILRCEKNCLYTGITSDVERRFREHCEGKGAKYTKTHPPLGVEAVWEAVNKNDASRLEYRIKALTKDEKEDLILNGEKELVLKVGEEKLSFKRLL
jgi:putative endonuclease